MPIQLKSKTRVESVALPGAAFTVRRMSHLRLAGIDIATLDAQKRLTRITREWMLIMGDSAKLATRELIAERLGKLTPDELDRIGDIDREHAAITAHEIWPARIKAGIISIEGIIGEDGAALDTPDKLLAAATPELNGLIEEMFQACEKASGLDAEETKNLPLPTTGTEPATT
jgi:hypothetical protein